MRLKQQNELPGTRQRIASVLRSDDVRMAIAERAAKHELSAHKEFEFSSDLIASHLETKQTEKADIDFFSTRHLSEAIILEVGRPVLLVRDGIIDKAELPLIERKLSDVRSYFIEPVGSVGRIELSDHDTYDWCGTGWRVDENLIITNRHVAEMFAQQESGEFRFRLNRSGKLIRTRIDFREEYKGIESEEYGIAEILWMAPNTDAAPDLAILRVLQDPGLPPPLNLSGSNVVEGQEIAVVGYPAKDSRNDARLMSTIFGDIFDVKRFAPGEVVTSEANAWYLTHDATTLGGNSGSAVFDLFTREVVGLHFGGMFRKTNYAVKTSVIKNILARKSWVSVLSESLKIEKETFKEKKRSLDSMSDRRGYDPSFLAQMVATPRPGKSHSLLETGEDNLLHYTHFSILMSKSRRFPVFTAENLDGELKMKFKRRDSWGFDPRIPREAQVGHKEFYGPESFDKGHMVRRENPGWGTTPEEAQLGEDDTFVYTNAVPQMPQLNQRTWLSLENYVLENARTLGFKICVFTGPIFRDDDPVCSGIQVPTDFWKVVVSIDSSIDFLLTSAYLLSQEGMMPLEGFRYGPFKTYQVPLSRIEQLADLRFSKSIRNADVFSVDETRETISSSIYIEINSADDIILIPARLT